jgi:hypothetical protein
MEIPARTNNGEIMLDGVLLQTQYRSLLQTIVSEICSEYAINFGDVYVQSVTAGSVVLGMEICYGPPITLDERPEYADAPMNINFS